MRLIASDSAISGACKLGPFEACFLEGRNACDGATFVVLAGGYAAVSSLPAVAQQVECDGHVVLVFSPESQAFAAAQACSSRYYAGDGSVQSKESRRDG